ncbi:unnamed protein product [Cylicocyclus nassatus]|uniref:Uncharacterized protein n=1 Tax=Cylicocyclus nassatus TaxID=53992 RepID=A0AA36DUW4_CYLNA|nr:unnamed protein product [Cylicocyclus nassatus]
MLMLVQIPADVLEPSAKGDVINIATKQKGYRALVIAILFHFGSGIISNVFGGLSHACLQRATSLAGRKMKVDLFKSMLNKDIAFFDANPSGELVARLDDCDTASEAVSADLITFVQNIVLTISSLVFVLIYSWRLTVLFFITFPTMYIMTEMYGNFSSRLYRKSRSMSAKVTQLVTDVLSTMRTVRSFGCERREVKRFSDNLDKLLLLENKSSLGSAGWSWTVDIAQNLTDALVMLYGGHQILTGRMPPAVLTTYFLYMDRLDSNVHYIIDTMTSVWESLNATEQLLIYMKQISDHEKKGTEKPGICGKVEVKSVDFAYPSRSSEKVLKDVNLKIEAGSTVALVGASGGGKSTIVALLEQFYKPLRGSITLDGTPVEKIDHEYYHEKISLVAQEPVLYDCSIRENILYGCEWATEEDMIEATKMANAHNFVTGLEKGYDTCCGERGAQLSGGQKQRIALARALVRKPTVLILDEATSALDSHSEYEIQQALKRIAGTLTVLIVAHRLSTVKNADCIYVIENGTIVQSGTHTELLRDVNGTYFSLVAKQRSDI